MSTRVIKLKLLTQLELVKVVTDARTFAELKATPEVKALSIDWSSAKLIDRASKASFDLDEAVLPAIDALMFVTPTKTKSGIDLPYKEVKAKIKEYKDKGGVVNFNYTQATTVKLNEFWSSISIPSKVIVKEVNDPKSDTSVDQELLKEVENLVKSGSKLQAVTLVEYFATMILKEAVNFVDNFKVKSSVAEVKTSIFIDDIAEVITKDDLQSEAQILKDKKLR